MSLPIIELATDHRLIDNGCGDYALDCPTHGDMGWLHLGQVAHVLHGDCLCGGCDKPLVDGK
jgi:hypothetical protein